MGGPWIVGSARASLQPLPVVLARTEVRRVAWDGTSSWSRTRYSVPAAYAGEPLLVWELDSGELVVEGAGEVILRYPVGRKSALGCTSTPLTRDSHDDLTSRPTYSRL